MLLFISPSMLFSRAVKERAEAWIMSVVAGMQGKGGEGEGRRRKEKHEEALVWRHRWLAGGCEDEEEHQPASDLLNFQSYPVTKSIINAC